jgi:NAD-dependent dihydropyrimidine dehydrogenase PreA subunit
MFPSGRRPILLPPQVKKFFRIEIDREQCDGCRLCTVFCPLDVLHIGTETNRRMLHYAAVENPLTCLGCEQCQRICPTAAIVVYEVGSEREVIS